ncbi:hypothetical protein GGH16_005832, partial [Coemansia sp. RSA 560]
YLAEPLTLAAHAAVLATVLCIRDTPPVAPERRCFGAEHVLSPARKVHHPGQTTCRAPDGRGARAKATIYCHRPPGWGRCKHAAAVARNPSLCWHQHSGISTNGCASVSWRRNCGSI